MSAQVQFAVNLQSFECGGCGITFAVPQSLLTRWRQEKGFTLRCPNPSCP